MRPSSSPPLLVTGAMLAGLLLSGCGAPPGLDQEPTAPGTPPAGSPGGSSAPPTPAGAPGGAPTGGVPSPGAFPEEIAVGCGGEPGDAEILALLRVDELLAGDDAEVVEGPYCSGDWQYAVVQAPDRDPLQVVTHGEPGELELVTAGTDVCSVEVRIQAPAGIQSAAAC